MSGDTNKLQQALTTKTPQALYLQGSTGISKRNLQQALLSILKIGKDEVPGPNPGSSSMKKFLIYVLLAEIRGFFVSKSSEFQKSKVS